MMTQAEIRALRTLGRRKCEPAATYRAYDADGNALYIGSSYDPDRRLRQHELHSSWWPLAAYIRIDWYPDRALAFEMELEAIRAELPSGNKAGKPKVKS